MTTIQQLAQELLEALRPGCERIEIAGSIRRGKAEPKDIELVCIPQIERYPETDMFGEVIDMVEKDWLEHNLDILFRTTPWGLDRHLPRNGGRYKRLRHITAGVCCDLFITDAAQWGAQFVIRTGPADFSHMLVTRALRMGMNQEDGRLWRTHHDDTKTVIETPTEESYFAALGMKYIAPELRGKVAA